MRVRPLQKEEFKWPNLEEQQKWLKKEQFINMKSEGLVVTMSGKEVIPERSEELKTRLCVIAHSGGSGQYWQNSAGDLSVKNYVTVMLQMSSLPCNNGRGENTSIPV